jgi:transcription elongation GreA/GreB family factor
MTRPLKWDYALEARLSMGAPLRLVKSMDLEKKQLIDEIVAHLNQELSVIQNAARAAHEAATHDESRPEDEHDTRGIEAAYLAGAQANRAAEIQKQIHLVQLLPVRSFEENDPIALGACIDLDQEGRKSTFFLVAQGGGISFTVNGKKIHLITPQSPIGESLLGKKKGDWIEVESQSGTREYQIVGIS